jgi:hypothetical protein
LTRTSLRTLAAALLALGAPLSAQEKVLSDYFPEPPRLSEGPSPALREALGAPWSGVRIHNPSATTLLVQPERLGPAGEGEVLYHLVSDLPDRPALEIFTGPSGMRFTVPPGAHVDLYAAAPPHRLIFLATTPRGEQCWFPGELQPVAPPAMLPAEGAPAAP